MWGLYALASVTVITVRKKSEKMASQRKNAGLSPEIDRGYCEEINYIKNITTLIIGSENYSLIIRIENI